MQSPPKKDSAPLFRHGSDCCVFVGTTQCSGLKNKSHSYDLYVCNNGPIPTVIARYGDKGDEYISGIPFVGMSEPLTEAFKRAQDLGILFVVSNKIIMKGV